MTLPASIGADFVPTLLAQVVPLGIDPKGAVQALLFESGLNPAIMNSIGAVGINQFLPMNYGYFAPLSVGQYRQLTAAQQLPYVAAFWRDAIRRNGKGATSFSGRDLYWMNIQPAKFVPNAPDSFVVMRPNTDGAYEANKGALDFGNKGFITAGDFSQALQNAANHNASTWNALSQQIDAASGSFSAGSSSELVTIAAVGVLLGFAGYAAFAPAKPVYRRRRMAA